MIEVGEYGRTNTGKIFIFAWLEYESGKREESKVLLGNGKIIENKFYYFKENEKIVKHSPNIIDLIEEGDYVNGVRILDVTGDYIHTAEYDCCKERLSKKLKSIVTHEQFKSVEYIVGGKE